MRNDEQSPPPDALDAFVRDAADAFNDGADTWKFVRVEGDDRRPADGSHE